MKNLMPLVASIAEKERHILHDCHSRNFDLCRHCACCQLCQSQINVDTAKYQDQPKRVKSECCLNVPECSMPLSVRPRHMQVPPDQTCLGRRNSVDCVIFLTQMAELCGSLRSGRKQVQSKMEFVDEQTIVSCCFPYAKIT